MAQSHPFQLTSYDRLTMRVSRLVNNARGVIDRHVHVERLEASSEDWELLLEAFEETEGLVVTMAASTCSGRSATTISERTRQARQYFRLGFVRRIVD